MITVMIGDIIDGDVGWIGLPGSYAISVRIEAIGADWAIGRTLMQPVAGIPVALLNVYELHTRLGRKCARICSEKEMYEAAILGGKMREIVAPLVEEQLRTVRACPFSDKELG